MCPISFCIQCHEERHTWCQPTRPYTPSDTEKHEEEGINFNQAIKTATQFKHIIHVESANNVFHIYLRSLVFIVGTHKHYIVKVFQLGVGFIAPPQDFLVREQR